MIVAMISSARAWHDGIVAAAAYIDPLRAEGHEHG
jgi:hypothetical protein